ncbi:hypothetical protein EPO15_06985 [bacterium]|nr:MAG: hypothetical protein EPO15_06985 [bacterium]
MEHPCLSPWKGAVAGGLIAFVWGAVSWTVLPLHAWALGPDLPPPAGDAMARMLLTALILQGFGGFWWTWILGKIPGLTSLDAAKYGAMFGLCLGALGALPDSVWWNASWANGLVETLDYVVAWGVASPVIARWCRAAVCALPKR